MHVFTLITFNETIDHEIDYRRFALTFNNFAQYGFAQTSSLK